jgi:hypothetical protein
VPILVALALAVALVVLFVLLIPVSLFMRYRVATSRRRQRGWIVTSNVISLLISLTLLLGTAIVMSLWVDEAVPWVAMGLGVGAALGFLGLWASHWEEEADGLYLTGNRWLVTLVSLVVVARIALGFWRAWVTWKEGGLHGELAAIGIAGSMAAGAVLVGYSLVYWAGVRSRLRRLAADPS